MPNGISKSQSDLTPEQVVEEKEPEACEHATALIVAEEKYEASLKSLRHHIWRLKGLNYAGYREERAYRHYVGKTLINIGSGTFFHKHWTNLDVSSAHYDAMRKGKYLEYNAMTDKHLPFEDGEVSLAYTSHTIEHIKDDYVQNMFTDVHRVLGKGGVFRITCPDADLYYQAMVMNNMDRFFQRRRRWFDERNIPETDVSPIDYMVMALATKLWSDIALPQGKALKNELEKRFHTLSKEDFFEDLTGRVAFVEKHIACHLNWWNMEKTTRFLKEAGFTNIRPSTFGGSVAAPFSDVSIFDNTLPDESLYVEAYKI